MNPRYLIFVAVLLLVCLSYAEGDTRTNGCEEFEWRFQAIRKDSREGRDHRVEADRSGSES